MAVSTPRADMSAVIGCIRLSPGVCRRGDDIRRAPECLGPLEHRPGGKNQPPTFATRCQVGAEDDGSLVLDADAAAPARLEGAHPHAAECRGDLSGVAEERELHLLVDVLADFGG